MPRSQADYIAWQPEVGQRGTFTIITTCLSTLIICVWSSLHLSIPNGRRTWFATLRAKLLWATIGLLLPEYLIWVAWKQRVWAAEIRDDVNEHFGLKPQKSCYSDYFRGSKPKVAPVVQRDTEKVSVACDSVSSCGGSQDEEHRAQLLASPSKQSASQEQTPSEGERTSSISRTLVEEHDSRASLIRNEEIVGGGSGSTGNISVDCEAWSLVQGFYIVMGGLAYRHRELDCKDKSRWTAIDAESINLLLSRYPEVVSDISIHDIHNKSKADGLAKAVLLLQVVWFCFSCLHRLIQHLPLTLLEVSTVAHALCSMTVYVIWWGKPLNIEEPTIIRGAEEYEWYDRSSNSLSMEVRYKFDQGDIFPVEGPSMDSTIVLTIIGLLYGAPHLLAWNSIFATQAEQLLWRVTSCIVALIPLCSLIIAKLYDPFFYKVPSSFHRVLMPLLTVLLALAYLPSSLYLIAGSIRQLFYLTPAAFQVPPWSNYFPHVS